MSIVDEAAHALLHAVRESGTMSWQIGWSLVLGFTLSAMVESLVPKSRIASLLPDDGIHSLATATGLGAASSSCSYAAVALARSLYRKGADFTAAMAFQIASTNLVVELGIIMALLLGWRFTLAEFVGAPIMIGLVALLLRRFFGPKLRAAAHRQAELAVPGAMEGHAAMDMSVAGSGGFWRRLTSPEGVTAVSHNVVMEVAAILRDLVIGLLVAGAAAAWIPDSFWRHLFGSGHPLLAALWGPLIGPLVAMLTSVCSIGNVPLAAVLWNGGISFGGVVAFIFADLIILPILVIYRKYYGTRPALRLFVILYVAMAGAGYLVELLFWALRLTPGGHRHAQVGQQAISWNYTSWLDVVALVVVALLGWRFVRTGAGPMLRMMGGGPDDMAHGHGAHDHASHDHGGGHDHEAAVHGHCGGGATSAPAEQSRPTPP